MKLVQQNLKPMALLALCTAIGFLCGHAAIGFCIGIIIIAGATLFL